jgi:hypothetical protein
MLKQVVFVALHLALASVCQAQTHLGRAARVANDGELAQVRVARQAELQRLNEEQIAACKPGANPAQCQHKSKQAAAARPALEQKIAWINTHEKEARTGMLVRAQAGMPAAKVAPGNCASCHTGASAKPTEDAIPVALAPTGPTPGSTSGGKVVPPATRCFIATAAFGSEDADEVKTLRRFRDEHLLGNVAGDWFVGTYYALSPSVADALSERPAARAVVRAGLRVVVFAIGEPLWFALLAAAMFAMLTFRRRVFGSRQLRGAGAS